MYETAISTAVASVLTVLLVIDGLAVRTEVMKSFRKRWPEKPKAKRVSGDDYWNRTPKG